MRRENLELQLVSIINQKGKEQLVKKYEELIDDYKQKIKKYEEEKEEITKAVTGFEKEHDECKNHSGKFGIAVIFLQISILLSSIATLSKKKFVWICSLILGIIGIFFFIDGFFLIFRTRLNCE